MRGGRSKSWKGIVKGYEDGRGDTLRFCETCVCPRTKEMFWEEAQKWEATRDCRMVGSRKGKMNRETAAEAEEQRESEEKKREEQQEEQKEEGEEEQEDREEEGAGGA